MSQIDTDVNHRTSVDNDDIHEEIIEPKVALKSTLDQNLLTGEKNSHSKDKIKAIIDQAEIILTDLSLSLQKDNLSMRALLNNYVYTMDHPTTKQEIEIVTISDLSKCLLKYNPTIFSEE